MPEKVTDRRIEGHRSSKVDLAKVTTNLAKVDLAEEGHRSSKVDQSTRHRERERDGREATQIRVWYFVLSKNI